MNNSLWLVATPRAYPGLIFIGMWDEGVFDRNLSVQEQLPKARYFALLPPLRVLSIISILVVQLGIVMHQASGEVEAQDRKAFDQLLGDIDIDLGGEKRG